MSKEKRSEIDLFSSNCLEFARKMHKSDIRNDIRNLWQSLTRHRGGELQKYFRTAGSRRAYIGYYFPVYVAKIFLLLTRLLDEGSLSKLDLRSLKVWDLGSGTLTGLAALRMFLGEHPAKALAVDKSLAPMRLGLDVMCNVFGNDSARSMVLRQANLFGPVKAFQSAFQPNLIFLGHVLNEFGEGQKGIERGEQFLETLLASLEDGGIILIVEPATRSAARLLMALRDFASARNDVEILAPCTGANECPLLMTPNSWCFSEFAWEVPKVFRKIDADIGFRREVLKSSFLVIHKTQTGPQKSDKLRIVSGEMRSGSDYRRYLCTSEGLRTLRTKLATASSSKLENLKRGELLPEKIKEQSGVAIELED